MAAVAPSALSLSPAVEHIAGVHGLFYRRRRRRLCFHGVPATRGRSLPRSVSWLPPLSCVPRALEQDRSIAANHTEEPAAADETEDDSSYSVLAALSSMHNDIVVVETPKARFLLLDSTHNIHSMVNKEHLLTGSYWDEFAALPAIIPEGPIAILGLGGGTAAHLMLDLWPNLQLHGWEIDPILIDMAREYFGLSTLENCTKAGGSLVINIGDALSESATIEGGFAGIIVDLFSAGKVIPELKEVETWLALDKKLMPHGRIMVNSGGAHSEVSGNNASSTGSWVKNGTIKALCQAFPGHVSWKRMAEIESDNYLALTGPMPDLEEWSAAVPRKLSLNVKDWQSCDLSS